MYILLALDFLIISYNLHYASHVYMLYIPNTVVKHITLFLLLGHSEESL